MFNCLNQPGSLFPCELDRKREPGIAEDLWLNKLAHV